MRVVSLETTDSTNRYASSLLASGAEEGTVVVAEEQTAGRGRQGKAWFSEKGLNLTFSLILKPDAPAASAGIISLYAALSVAEGTSAIAGISPECKWPNDLLSGGRKFCGILSEAVFDRGRLASVVVGIGLNVNQTKFPPAIQPPPTSLAIETGRTFELTSLLSALLDSLEKNYQTLRSGDYGTIIREWTLRSATIGRLVTVRSGDRLISGTATKIAEDGGLMIRSNGTETKVVAGDVTMDIPSA
jgi:BirA family biotin operon repressor/biotin-[acetyl-CoA-carboxylase] ligase